MTLEILGIHASALSRRSDPPPKIALLYTDRTECMLTNTALL